MDSIIGYFWATIGELSNGNVRVWITLIIAAVIIIFVLHLLWELLQKFVTGLRILFSEPKKYKSGIDSPERVAPVLNTLNDNEDENSAYTDTDGE